MSVTLLARYGRVPEVARVRSDIPRTRGEQVVIQTHRGLELGTVLDVLKASKSTEEEVSFHVVRVASVDDHGILARQTDAAAVEFTEWNRRIAKWGIDVQLVELERTLDDDKLILYVLNERGPECTRLAIQAAAEGLGIIEVQPVAREGLVPPEPKGGCGTCDCSH